jgi:hypothetical protein
VAAVFLGLWALHLVEAFFFAIITAVAGTACYLEVAARLTPDDNKTKCKP